MNIKRTLIGTLSASLLGLSLFAYGPHPHIVSSTPQWHATWLYHPKSLGEAKAKASEVVVARVVEVKAGPDIVVPVQGAPHFFRKEQLVVLYVGEDQAVVNLLTKLLGPQIAGG